MTGHAITLTLVVGFILSALLLLFGGNLLAATYLGAEAMATRQYALNISSYIFLFSVAVSMGTSIIVGHLVGARRQDEAYTRVFSSVKWALLVTVIIDAAVSFFLETGRTCNLVIINSLRASGDAKFPVYMGLISMVCMSMPLGYVLVFHLHLGLAGVWIATAFDEWVRAVIMYFRWKSSKEYENTKSNKKDMLINACLFKTGQTFNTLRTMKITL